MKEECINCRHSSPGGKDNTICHLESYEGKKVSPDGTCNRFVQKKLNAWKSTRGFWKNGSPLDDLKDFMWKTLLEKGQKPNPRALRGYCYDIIQAMSQMTGGEHSSSKADYIGFADIYMIAFSVICEVTALVRSGAIDKPIDMIEEVDDENHFWKHDTYPWKTMDKHRLADGPSDTWSFLRPGGQQANIPFLKDCVNELVRLTQNECISNVQRIDELAGFIVMESMCLVLSNEWQEAK